MLSGRCRCWRGCSLVNVALRLPRVPYLQDSVDNNVWIHLKHGTKLLLTHLLSSFAGWASGKAAGLGRTELQLLWTNLLPEKKTKTFCCLLKHFQTRLTISVHISAGWRQCFCSGHVIIRARFSLWKKKDLGLKLKESHFYRLLEKDLFSALCPTKSCSFIPDFAHNAFQSSFSTVAAALVTSQLHTRWRFHSGFKSKFALVHVIWYIFPMVKRQKMVAANSCWLVVSSSVLL